MALLKFSPEADSYLTELEEDPRSRSCAIKVNTALDRLEENPGASENRRRRFQSVDLWGIPLRCGDEDLVILWGYHVDEDETVIVHYIGPSP